MSKIRAGGEQRREHVQQKLLLNPAWLADFIFQPIGQFDQFAILCHVKAHACIVGSMIIDHFIRMTITWLIVTFLEVSGFIHMYSDIFGLQRCIL